MPIGILERELDCFFPKKSQKPTNIAGKLIQAICRRFSNGTRILMMPAGSFAAELAEQISGRGFSIVNFLDNFKEEGSDIAGLAKVVCPSKISEIEFDELIIATPSITAQAAMLEQLTELLPERKNNYHILLDFMSSNFDDIVTQTVKDLQKGLCDSPKGKRVCVISNYMCHSYLKRLFYLKLAGFHVTVITGSNYLNGSSVSIYDFKDKGYYDQCYATNLYDVIMPKILVRLNFDLVHAIVSTDSPLCTVKALQSVTCPFITEYWDFKEILFAEL